MSGKTSLETYIYTCGTENPHLKTPINLHGERSLGNNFTYPTFIHTHYIPTAKHMCLLGIEPRTKEKIYSLPM